MIAAVSMFVLVVLVAVSTFTPSLSTPRSNLQDQADKSRAMNQEEGQEVFVISLGSEQAEEEEEEEEVFVISLGSEQAEEEMVQALTAGCGRRVTSLRSPLTREMMATTGPEQYIISLIHNQTVKIVLLEVEDKESLRQDKSSLQARYAIAFNNSCRGMLLVFDKYDVCEQVVSCI